MKKTVSSKITEVANEEKVNFLNQRAIREKCSKLFEKWFPNEDLTKVEETKGGKTEEKKDKKGKDKAAPVPPPEPVELTPFEIQ